MGDRRDPAGRPASTADDFLATARVQPTGLLIEGDAGIGKTTLWQNVLDAAGRSGFVVLSARTAAAEFGIAHATVADLFASIDTEVLDELPEMQRQAADQVLLRDQSTGRPGDERVAAAALLGAIHAVSARAPVLLAVDDVQWLDPSSRAVLGFVARRLKGPVGIVVTERTGEAGGEPAASWLHVGTSGFMRVRVASMSLGALHTMLAARLQRRFSRPAIVRIAEVSGGNPLYALELARVVDDGPLGSGTTLPATLAEVVRLRVEGLTDDVRDVLLVAASETVPTVELLAGALDVTADAVTTLLEAAETEGIVVIEGNRIRFTHPLLARGIYDGAQPARRRAFHRRLAQISTQPELQARHLALAATSADAATIEALDRAADSARRRGAPAAAAELVELAIARGGDTVSRRIRAAEHHYVAGDMPRAAALLDGALGDLRPGVLRAIALNLSAAVRMYEDDYAQAVTLLRQACEDAADDEAVLVASLISLGFAQGMTTGAFADQVATVRRSVEIAERVGVPMLTSQALSMWVHVGAQAGFGVDEVALGRAVALESADDDTPIPFRASATRGLMLAVTGHLAEADTQLDAVAQRCRLRGAEHDAMFVTAYQTLVAIWRGRYDEADRLAADVMERAEQLGGSMVIACSISGAAHAYRGREAHARECARAALAGGGDYAPLTSWARTTLTFLEASLGNYEAVVRVAAPLIDRYRPFAGTEVLTASFLPDAAEALVAVGQFDDAEEVVSVFERNGAALDRPWLLAVGNRCRAMLLAAEGQLGPALDAAERAMAAHDRLPMPFERARTALTLADVLRRTRRRDDAAAAAGEALRCFEELGTPLWAARARHELARSTVARRAHSVELTESERRIAELVASGMSNREVADALYVSVKTVETNLTRAYRKLGIRSRAQLGKRLRETGGS